MVKKQSRISPSEMLSMLQEALFRKTSLAHISRTMEERMHSGISFRKVFRVITIGANRAVHPTIINVLKILLPTTLPTAMSGATFQGGRYANGQFRGGSSESYDSQADYDGRNTESLGYGRAPSVRQLAPIKMRSNPPISSNISMSIPLNYGFGCKYNDFDLCYVKNNLYVWHVYPFR